MGVEPRLRWDRGHRREALPQGARQIAAYPYPPMSMPCLVYTCQRCDYVGFSTAFWGQFSYEWMGTLLDVDRERAWCNACSTFVPVERFPTARDLGELQTEIDRLGVIVAEQVAEARAGRTWWQRVSKTAPVLSRETNELRQRLVQTAQDLSLGRRLVEMLSGRVAAPRCLWCGGTDWFALREELEPSGTYLRPGPPIAIGVVHPTCGGELLVQYSEDHPHILRRHRIYDSEGVFLRDLHQPGGPGTAQPDVRRAGEPMSQIEIPDVLRRE